MIQVTKLLQEQLEKMCETGRLYRCNIESSLLWMGYLEGFGVDKKFRSLDSSVHNCNYCHNFINRYGNLVAIDQDLNLINLFDIDNVPEEYAKSFKIMSDLIKSQGKIVNIFVETFNFLNDPKTPYGPVFRSNTKFHLGVEKNIKRYTKEDVDRWPNSGVKVNDVFTFNHMFIEMPKEFIDFSGRSREELESIPRQYREVFKRGLEEISIDTFTLVRDLEAQGSLLNGESYKRTIDMALRCAQEYKEVPASKKENWLWVKALQIGPACAFRNTAIGSLMVDLAEGKEINEACREFNRKVDPVNYMKATAPITKRQIEDAKKFVEDNGYSESFERRCATLEDIKVCDILHSNTDAAEIKTKVSVFDKITPTTCTRHKKSEFKGVEEVTIEKFMKDILPGCTQVELYFSNKMKNNCVTLLTSKNKDSKRLFKWNNNFSWTYNGNLAGKSQIKSAVKSAGGYVDAPFRFSIMWNYDENSKGIIDLDAHAKDANNTEIYYGSHKGKNNKTNTGGCLDIDMINPESTGVENIFWENLDKLEDGNYKFWINNFSGRQSGANTKAEIFINGNTYQYLIPRVFKGRENINIATLTIKNKELVEIKQGPYFVGEGDENETPTEIYGINTCEFHKVNLVCLSPNYWDESGVGNKHYFFMLEGCKCPDEIRSIHNEYLAPDLLNYRKVMEVLGNTLRVPSTNNQLSGVGFNATVHDEVILKLSGSHKRIIKVKF